MFLLLFVTLAVSCGCELWVMNIPSSRYFSNLLETSQINVWKCRLWNFQYLLPTNAYSILYCFIGHLFSFYSSAAIPTMEILIQVSNLKSYKRLLRNVTLKFNKTNLLFCFCIRSELKQIEFLLFLVFLFKTINSEISYTVFAVSSWRE